MKKLFTTITLSILVLAGSTFGIYAQSIDNNNINQAPEAVLSQEENLEKIGNILEENYGEELEFFTEIVFDGVSTDELMTMDDNAIDAYLEENYGAMVDDFLEEAFADITEEDINEAVDELLEDVFGDITEEDVDNLFIDIFGGTSDEDIDRFIDENFAGKTDEEIDNCFDDVLVDTIVKLLEASVY